MCTFTCSTSSFSTLAMRTLLVQYTVYWLLSVEVSATSLLSSCGSQRSIGSIATHVPDTCSHSCFALQRIATVPV